MAAGDRVRESSPEASGPVQRLPDETRLGLVRLRVADLDRSLAYYGRVLGLEPIGRDAGTAALAAPGVDMPLLELRERPGAAPSPAGGRPGLYHFAILLPDRADLGAFAAHLGRLGVGAGASDHEVSEALYLRDPDGLGIEVYADRPRERWRSRDGQLVMSTLPLDVPGLVRFAGPRPWNGMPPGAAMGHIHLHVGDLGRASDFYHRGLGLDRTVWSYPGALFLSAGGYHHHLGLNTWARSSAPGGEDEAGLVDWELVVPGDADVSGTARRMERAGFTARDSGSGILARDPWGTAVRIRRS